MTKTVYLFDEMTGEYKGYFDCQESPLEPGEFIAPESSTDMAPPSCSDGQRRIFQGGVWIVEDTPQPEPTPAPTRSELIVIA